MARLLMILILFGVGCESDDTGADCRAKNDNQALIPQPMCSNPPPPATPAWIDDIALDPAFLCENFTCVTSDGSTAYCTKKCDNDNNCPEGFACVAVLQSDPGPGSNIDRNDKFCLKTQPPPPCP